MLWSLSNEIKYHRYGHSKTANITDLWHDNTVEENKSENTTREYLHKLAESLLGPRMNTEYRVLNTEY